MNYLWTSHLPTTKEKEDFKALVIRARPVLERLGELIKQKDQSLIQREVSLSTYETPNWDYKQAHINGYRSTIAWLETLLNIDTKDANDHGSIYKTPISTE